MDTLQILTTNPEVAKNIRVEVSGADLLAFGEFIHQAGLTAGLKAGLKMIAEEEAYLAPKAMAAALHVNLATLWNWDKKGITTPIFVANEKDTGVPICAGFLTKKGPLYECAPSFEQLPQMVAELSKKLDLLLAQSQHPQAEADKLMTLDELREYLADKPARQTVYMWVNDRKIPFLKYGKRLFFRQSVIISWLANGRRP